MNLAGKNIVLTGASSGIGRKILDLLLQYQDTKVVAVARNTSSIPTLQGRIYPLSADLSTQEGVDKLFEISKAQIGDIDIFIANAGFAYMEENESPDWERIEKIFGLNVNSVIYSLERLKEEARGRKIHFVATCSAVAFVPLHAYALYCSSKAALHQFMEAYRYEKGENLTLTVVYPVATSTHFFDRASGTQNTPSPWPTQSVDVVARKIVKGITKEKKRIYPSTLFRIFYPIGRMFPFLLRIYSSIEKKKTKRWLRR